MKSILNFIAMITLMITVLGCENFMTRNDVRENEEKKQFKDQVSTLQKGNADLGNRFADIDQDLRSLNGRVEVVESKLNQSNTEHVKTRANTEQSVQDQAKKVQILQDEVAKLHEEVAGLTAEMNAMKAAGPAAEAGGDKGKKDSFEAGEEHFDKKDWKKAIVSYQKFRDSNPKSKKFPEATYKIGVCFQELGLKDEAKTFYDEVVAKFPNSAEAKKAKTHLKSLKK